MKILITGGTGFLGKKLAARLAGEGHSVVITSRNTLRTAPPLDVNVNNNRSPGSISVAKWDYKSGPPASDVVSGAEVVFHLVGENIGEGRWTDDKKKELVDSRVVSTRRLIEALPESVRFFLCASAIAYYPSSDSITYTEEWAGAAMDTDFLGRLVRAWEEEAGQAPCRVVTLRIGLVLGEAGILKRMLPIFRLGLGGRLAGGGQWMSWIHIDDLVSLMIFAMNQKISGPVNATAPEPVTNAQFTRLLAQAVKRPAFVFVPKFALKLAMGEASELALASQRVLPGKAVSAGFSFKFPTVGSAFQDLI